MIKKMVSFALCLAMVLVLIGGQLQGSSAEATEMGTCDAMALASCADAILMKKRPSQECCNAIESQFSCLCELLKDPRFGQYKDEGKRVIKECGLLKTPPCL